MKIRNAIHALIAGASLLMGLVAHAEVMLTAENPGAVLYQQQQNSPCVIGYNNCQNPSGFGYTEIPAGSSGEAYILTSPSYTVQQIADIVGNAFYIGIDVNTARTTTISGTNYASEILLNFYATINGTSEFRFTGPLNLATAANGTGYSDVILKTFDFSGFARDAIVTFTASIENASDGREQFFLISATTPGGPGNNVPEPGTTALLGMGLLGMGFAAKRRMGKQA
jgi:hypothetical protein